MGGFQAVAAGLGEAGEDFGKGFNNAMTEALKLRSQQHLENMDVANLDLRNRQLQQSYDIAQQEHALQSRGQDITREGMMQQGWMHISTVRDPASGQYYQVWQNPRTGENRKVPFNGSPPDSPEGLMAYYRQLADQKDEKGNPLFTENQAKEIAFKMPNLYRTDPAGVYTGFRETAMETLGMDEKAATKWADKMYAEYVGRGGYFRAQMGGVGQHDLTGLTAGEQRLYKSTVAPIVAQEQAIKSLMGMEMQMAFTPEQQAMISNKYLPTLMQLYQADANALQAVREHRTPNVSPTIAPGNFTNPAGPPSGAANSDDAFQKSIAGAPPATGLKDGTPLNSRITGRAVAVAKGGKWVPAPTQ